MKLTETTALALLGRQPALGMAELESLYGHDAVEPVAGGSAALIRRPAGDVAFGRLGGTRKLCVVLGQYPASDWRPAERALLADMPKRAAAMPEGKVHLGLSVYGMDWSPQQLLASGLRLKHAISQRTGRTVRLVPNKQPELNTAQVLHHKLTGPNGMELVLVHDVNRLIVAQTVQLQDIEAYAKRDQGRPKRDARVGMLPPKLAQIIVNLATGAEQTQAPAAALPRTLLDPFCGTGVILQEALLMGFAAYGTDKEPRMIDYTRANLAWLAAQQPLPGYRLEPGDATSHHWTAPVQVVASEIYLGRPFTTAPPPEVLAQTITDCTLIAKKFLQHIRPQLAPGTRLCLAVPAWQVRPGTFRHLPLIDHLTEMGYNRVSLQHVRDSNLLYYRPDQIVARELLIITRN